jgi:hypothetical protein
LIIFAAGFQMKFFKKIAVISLAGFLLLSSVGIGINKMMCLSGGKTKMSFFEKPTCCPADEKLPSPDFSVDARCCDYLSDYVQVDYLSVENQLKLKVIQVAVITAVLHFNFSLQHKTAFSAVSDAPPLLHGFSLLKFISVFRI